MLGKGVGANTIFVGLNFRAALTYEVAPQGWPNSQRFT